MKSGSIRLSLRRLVAIQRKEFIHIIRDPRTLMILFLMPITMIVLFGYAVRLDIKNISLAVWDQDQTLESRSLIEAFEKSGYYKLEQVANSRLKPNQLFIDNQAIAVLTIPVGYGESLVKGTPLPLQFIADAVDSNTATIASQYAEQIIFEYSQAYLNGAKIPADIRVLVLYNPQLESTHFIVPGLVAIIFMMVCALLTAVTIAREKETGTMEQILVSPVKVREIIIGKVFPYVILSAGLGLLVILLSIFWFKVPFRGNPWVLAAYSLIYILCALSFGILISTKAKTMQVALMVALIATMLPSVMLSGFMFPIASMPRVIRGITHLVPARYYLVIIRGVMLKDADWSGLSSSVIALSIFAFVLITISVQRFKTSLE